MKKPLPTVGTLAYRRNHIYGRLYVKEYWGSDAAGRGRLLCMCRYGNNVVVGGHHLASGHTRSCSCLKKRKKGDK